MAWWDTLGVLEQIFIIIAAPATIILIIQTLMLLFGGIADLPDSGLDSDISGLGGSADWNGGADTGGGMDMGGMDMGGADTGGIPPDGSADPGIHHADLSGLRLFSLNGILAFLTVSGWSGIVFLELGLSELFCVLFAFILGTGALFAMAFLLRALMKLPESGNKDYRRALGKTAQVYLTVPPMGSGQGKINLMLGETMGEFWAVSNSREPIPTGTSVRVVDLSGGVYTVTRED